jgi:chromosome segregation ATPase
MAPATTRSTPTRTPESSARNLIRKDHMDPNEAPAQQDTPESAPTGTPDQQINFEQRYNDLRPQFDRIAQEAAQLRAERERLQNDEDYQRELLKQLGYEIEDPAPAADPTAAELAALRQQVTELSGWRDNLTQEQVQAQQLQVLEQSVNEQFKAIPDLDEADREWVEDRALTRIPPREDGMPDIQAAYQALVERDNRVLTTRAKKRTSAPRFTPGGKEGTQAPNLDDPEEMLAWQMARLADLNAAS